MESKKKVKKEDEDSNEESNEESNENSNENNNIDKKEENNINKKDINITNNINNNENNNEKNNNIENNKDLENGEENEEEEDELEPPRPELDEITKQTIKLLSPPEDGPHHPRTIFFMNDPEINTNRQNLDLGLNLTDYDINKKKFMIVYKAYKNLPPSLSGPMKYNQVVRSKLFENTNLIWKLLPKEKMYLLFRKLNKFQKYNHFPIAWQLGRKDNLYINYTKMKKKFPNEYNFMPETYILPKDKEIVDELLKEYNFFDRENLYIVKPVASSRGRGVRVLSDVTTLPNKGILQKYIYNPHLINKKKI